MKSKPLKKSTTGSSVPYTARAIDSWGIHRNLSGLETG